MSDTARREGLAEVAALVTQRHDLWRRYDRAAENRLNLDDLTRRLDSNAREIADRLAADCACGCSDDMHVGEIGCPCALPDESLCGPPLALLMSNAAALGEWTKLEAAPKSSAHMLLEYACQTCVEIVALADEWAASDE